MDNRYMKAGGAWFTDKGIRIKLNNGIVMNGFSNEKKTQESHPDFNISMLTEQALKIGIEPYRKAVTEEDLDFTDIFGGQVVEN